jgi:Protein of unknown function (DUF1553)/Protein of unknown function (DUF1549)/Concanavalin A-like lectin/glucanases superfamily/Planctomycete cytochrome C
LIERNKIVRVNFIHSLRIIYSFRFFNWAACFLPCAVVSAAVSQGDVQYNRDVRPIIAEACYHCHGPDPASRKAELRFDRAEDFQSVRDGVGVVVPGKPAESLLWQRITTTDQDDVMPPPESHNQLKPEQKEIIRAWIEQGATWQKHWAFIAPERPALPKVVAEKWVKTPLDRFILARLEQAKLQPAAEAERLVLARRVSLDITGLPPTLAELEGFLADRRDDAYERYVDNLLAKKSYGEHRARYWLDAARYADTHGMHFDNFRDMYTYRDWVINAYNSNMPFDQFTTEQIAGDLLPNPTQSQLIATGFQRCNMTTNEGGTIDEENLAMYARDRVETVSWVYLALTANCASCHDHKFDPITQKDFYAMSAYFRNTTQGAKDDNIRDTPPVLVLPKESDLKRWEAIGGELAFAQSKLKELRVTLRGPFETWLKAATPQTWEQELKAFPSPAVHIPLIGVDKKGSIEPLIAEIKTEKGAEKTKADGANKSSSVASEIAWKKDGPFGYAPLLSGEHALSLSTAGDFEKDNPYTISAWVKIPSEDSSGALFSRMDEKQQHRGWDVLLEGNKISAHLIHNWPNNAIKITTNDGAFKQNKWQHLAVTYDGSAKAAGFAIYINGEKIATSVQVDALNGSTRVDAPFMIARRKQGDFIKGMLTQDVRIYERTLTIGEVKRHAKNQVAKKLLAEQRDKRDGKKLDELFDVIIADNVDYQKYQRDETMLQEEKRKIRERSPVAHIQEEKKGSQAMAYVLFRGEYDKKREQVEPAPFAALHSLPAGAPKNRLGLSQWLTSPENGLTARVMMNRLWQDLFGTGIVKSAEDFGVMGDAPSHPELLDYLAKEFMTDWNFKRMMKMMVLSATYQQSAIATSEKLEKDLANRLLSRGPRFRMDAEMIRDYALQSSGLLVEKIGGPSVRPYQPEGVWEAIAMPESSTRFYKAGTGEDLYRRSVYTFWKRMAPPAAMEILNAPNREVSCLRRERTNTPMQALVTLNDPQMIEAARVLAENVLAENRKNGAQNQHERGKEQISKEQISKEQISKEQISKEIARRILFRPLNHAEQAIVNTSYQRLLEFYQKHDTEAKALIAVGEKKADATLAVSELAALTMLANQLFNLDEVLNK